MAATESKNNDISIATASPASGHIASISTMDITKEAKFIALEQRNVDLSNELDIPLTAMISTHKDYWRKPNTFMFDYFVDNLHNTNGGGKSNNNTKTKTKRFVAIIRCVVYCVNIRF